jgi:TonB family protein
MTWFLGRERLFKRAIVVSLVLHGGIIVLLALSPRFPAPHRKGTIFYVPLGGIAGGGGPGGGPKAAVAAPPKKETLKDLTVASKVKPETKPSMTYPVDKPKKDKGKRDEKKASISRPVPETETAAGQGKPAAGSVTGEGAGSGLRIGLGEGPGRGGSGLEGQIGLSDFPFQYYLQIISDRVSSSWFTSLVDPGVSGTYATTVYFKILRDGRTADLKVTESSGIPSLDLSAQRAIQSSSPFPPLPREYRGEYLGIHLIFEHSK